MAGGPRPCGRAALAGPIWQPSLWQPSPRPDGRGGPRERHPDGRHPELRDARDRLRPRPRLGAADLLARLPPCVMSEPADGTLIISTSRLFSIIMFNDFYPIYIDI